MQTTAPELVILNNIFIHQVSMNFLVVHLELEMNKYLLEKQHKAFRGQRGLYILAFVQHNKTVLRGVFLRVPG